MAKHQDDKKKNKKKRSVSPDWSPWKDTGMGYEERTRKTPGDWKPRSTPGGKEFDDVFRNAREAGKDTFEWRGKTYSTKMAGGTEKEMRGPQYGKEKKPERMEPVKKRPVDIPPAESKRKVGGKIPGLERKHAAMYSKRKTSIDPDWKAKGKGGKAKAAYIAAKLSPLHSARAEGEKGNKRYHVGRQKIQTTTRPLKEKDAKTRTGELKPGVRLTMPGGEEYKGRLFGKTKRTKSGTATENLKATREEKRKGEQNLKMRKKKREEAYEKSSYRSY